MQVKNLEQHLFRKPLIYAVISQKGKPIAYHRGLCYISCAEPKASSIPSAVARPIDLAGLVRETM